ncbi:MAG: nitroreductase family protein [Acidimicrobiales bacterium]
MAPDERELAAILTVASTVPDHGGLRPWRFAVVSRSGRGRFGDALVEGLHDEQGNEVPGSVIKKMRDKAFAAPCCIMVVASPVIGSNVPEWEQVTSASCTGYAMVLAATSLGLGAIWKSASVLHTDPVRTLFGAAEHEQLLGWVNVGSPGNTGKRATTHRPDPDLHSLVTVISAEGTVPLE